VELLKMEVEIKMVNILQEFKMKRLTIFLINYIPFAYEINKWVKMRYLKRLRKKRKTVWNLKIK